MYLFVKIIVIFVCIIVNFVNSWNLSIILNDQNYLIRQVSIFYLRAFLCISKRDDGNYTIPTLIEDSWPEDLLPVIPKVFPSPTSHSKSGRDCNKIIQVVGTSVDEVNGHLWIIDNGSEYCKPKIIVYDLLKMNEEIHRYTFKNMPNGIFRKIKMYPGTKTNSIALLTLNNVNHLIMYSINHKKWWKLQLIDDEMIVTPKEIAFRKNKNLFITDVYDQLWNAKIDSIKKLHSTKHCITVNVNVTFVDNLLGPAKALITDPKKFLYYYLPRDGAVVRWNFRKQLTAENHDVLYLSPIPIMQIIFGGKGSVWIIHEISNENNDHCHRILYHFSMVSQL